MCYTGYVMVRKLLVYLLFMIVSCSVFFSIMIVRSPANIPPLILLVFFVSIFSSFYCLFGMIYVLFMACLRYFFNHDGSDVNTLQMVILLLVWSLAPTVLLAMNTVGANSALDFILVIVFEAIATFYVSRKVQNSLR